MTLPGLMWRADFSNRGPIAVDQPNQGCPSLCDWMTTGPDFDGFGTCFTKGSRRPGPDSYPKTNGDFRLVEIQNNVEEENIRPCVRSSDGECETEGSRPDAWPAKAIPSTASNWDVSVTPEIAKNIGQKQDVR